MCVCVCVCVKFDCEPPRLRNLDVSETSIMIDCLLVRYAECGTIVTLPLFSGKNPRRITKQG